MTQLEFFQAIEGVDEDEKSKAICCLQIQKEKKNKIIVEDTVNTTEAIVSLSIQGGIANIDLDFMDSLDYDFLHMTQLCIRFRRLRDPQYNAVEKAVIKEEGIGREMYSLVLTITIAGEYEHFLCAMDGGWSLMPGRLDENKFSKIRFTFLTEKVSLLELTDRGIQKIIDEAEYEILQEEEKGNSSHHSES